MLTNAGPSFSESSTSSGARRLVDGDVAVSKPRLKGTTYRKVFNHKTGEIRTHCSGA